MARIIRILRRIGWQFWLPVLIILAIAIALGVVPHFITADPNGGGHVAFCQDAGKGMLYCGD